MVLLPNIFRKDQVNAFQIIQKRNAMERPRETYSWTYYFPWLVGFGKGLQGEGAALDGR